MIETLKKLYIQISEYILLQEFVSKISECTPYITAVATMAAVPGIIVFAKNLPKILKKIEIWWRFRHRY